MILAITIKYFNDFNGQKMFNPGLGLYLMAFGGFMTVIVSLIPAKLLPNSLMHKFIKAPSVEA